MKIRTTIRDIKTSDILASLVGGALVYWGVNLLIRSNFVRLSVEYSLEATPIMFLAQIFVIIGIGIFLIVLSLFFES